MDSRRPPIWCMLTCDRNTGLIVSYRHQSTLAGIADSSLGSGKYVGNDSQQTDKRKLRPMCL
jgi:hypothetical protein